MIHYMSIWCIPVCPVATALTAYLYELIQTERSDRHLTEQLIESIEECLRHVMSSDNSPTPTPNEKKETSYCDHVIIDIPEDENSVL